MIRIVQAEPCPRGSHPLGDLFEPDLDAAADGFLGAERIGLHGFWVTRVPMIEIQAAGAAINHGGAV